MLLEKRCNDKVCELKMFLFGTKININTRVKNVSQCFFFMENSIKKKKRVLFILCLGTDYQVSVICEVNPVIFTYFFL